MRPTRSPLSHRGGAGKHSINDQLRMICFLLDETIYNKMVNKDIAICNFLQPLKKLSHQDVLVNVSDVLGNPGSRQWSLW